MAKGCLYGVCFGSHHLKMAKNCGRNVFAQVFDMNFPANSKLPMMLWDVEMMILDPKTKAEDVGSN